MDLNKLNAEGYPDPTCYAALTNIGKEEKLQFRPLVYICSPYRGDIYENTLRAQWYARFAVEKGYLPIAPHIYFTQFMDDDKPREREIAIFMNKVLLGKCKELWVFGDVISEGMQGEIRCAEHRAMVIRYFTEDLEEELKDA